MQSVVLGGSRSITRLTREVQERLERIVDKRLRVLVGDANGADKAFQNFFVDKRYEEVEVFCSGSQPRNNLGQWSCRRVSTSARPGTFAFFAAKDQAMIEEANYGLMLWNGDSAGTMLNVWRLLKRQRPTAVFLQHAKTFAEVRAESDWNHLLQLATQETRADIAKKLRDESRESARELVLL